MGLVDYSDSDVSEVEEAPKATAPALKATFQKVVDRSNPGKIKVSLPQAALNNDVDEPPAKRVKTGGGGLSGFNSFLPAPKNTGQNGNATKQRIGAGVSLKTGTAPGFSRDSESDTRAIDDSYAQDQDQEPSNGGFGSSLPLPKAAQDGHQIPADEVKLVGKPLMFKPLSVSRKPTKKKKAVAEAGPAAPAVPVTPATPQNVEKPPSRPKISLFSISAETSSPVIPTSRGEYQPMIYEAIRKGDDGDSSTLEPSYEEYTPNTSHVAPPAVPTPPVSQSLDDIAGDLNLSAAERRQLFGRQKGGARMQAATKIINFNTDEEYLHNEELRAAGEQVVHNPVRSIAPGKHSLKQLVNAAQSQKEALEESFAKGKSNRAEASSRYGW